MRRNFPFLTTLLVFLGGCLGTLNPIYTEKDLVLNPQLEGAWDNSVEAGDSKMFSNDAEITWLFELKKDKTYKLTHVADGDTAIFDAHLAKIGAQLYMDIYLKEPANDNYLYQMHLVAIHTFYKVQIDKNKLTLTGLNGEWVGEQVESGTFSLPTVKSENGIRIITASTDELQKFLKDNEDNKNVFDENAELTRIR